MTDDNAGVRIPPPLMFLAALLIGLWIDSAWASGQMASLPITLYGGIITLGGVALLIFSSRWYKRVGSNIEPWKPTTAIIKTGVYRYSRNPIYLGMAVVQAGLAIAAASYAALVTLAICMVIIQVYVIAREETYLENKFGAEYTDYKRSVRRWI